MNNFIIMNITLLWCVVASLAFAHYRLLGFFEKLLNIVSGRKSMGEG